MNEYDEIVFYCEKIVKISKHYSRREDTHRSILMLLDAIESYLDPPPDLGVHVTDGIKAEMKKGNGD